MSGTDIGDGLRLAVVRHGATALTGVWLNGCGPHAADPGLTAAGAAQAAAAAASLAEAGFQAAPVVSSPAQRARATAEAVASALGASTVALDGRLAEVDFGLWEGKRPGDLYAADPGRVRQWWTDPEFVPPQGESATAAGRRLADLVDEWRADSRPRSGVLVGHTTTVRALVGAALGVGHAQAMRLTVGPGAVAIVRLWADGGGCLDAVVQPPASIL